MATKAKKKPLEYSGLEAASACKVIRPGKRKDQPYSQKDGSDEQLERGPDLERPGLPNRPVESSFNLGPVTGNPDHVALLVGTVPQEPRRAYAFGPGIAVDCQDPVTGLKLACRWTIAIHPLHDPTTLLPRCGPSQPLRLASIAVDVRAGISHHR